MSQKNGLPRKDCQTKGNKSSNKVKSMAFSKFSICGTEWENIYTSCQQTKTSGGLILYQKEDNSPVSQRFFFTETLSKSNKYGNAVKIRENHRY